MSANWVEGFAPYNLKPVGATPGRYRGSIAVASKPPAEVWIVDADGRALLKRKLSAGGKTTLTVTRQGESWIVQDG